MSGFEEMFGNNGLKKPEKNKVENVKKENDTATNMNMTHSKKEKKATLGRPRTKTEDEKIINIAIPLSVYKKMNLAKLQYNNNLTLYINSLIERDLKENLEKYKEKLLDI